MNVGAGVEKRSHLLEKVHLHNLLVHLSSDTPLLEKHLGSSDVHIVAYSSCMSYND